MILAGRPKAQSCTLTNTGYLASSPRSGSGGLL